MPLAGRCGEDYSEGCLFLAFTPLCHLPWPNIRNKEIIISIWGTVNGSSKQAVAKIQTLVSSASSSIPVPMIWTQGIWALATVSTKQHGFSIYHIMVIYQELGTGHLFCLPDPALSFVATQIFPSQLSGSERNAEVWRDKFEGLTEGKCQFPIKFLITK